MDPATVALLSALGIGTPGVLAVGVVAAVRQARKARRDEAELAARNAEFARSGGLRFESVGSRRLFTGLLPLTPFGVGGPRTATNVHSGRWRGREVAGFCYSFVVSSYNGSTVRTTTHHWCVATVALPQVLPPLQVRPRFGRLREAVAPTVITDDIELESVDFNRRFHLSCPDARFASAFMHPRMMQRVLDNHASVLVRVDGDRLLLALPGVPNPDQVRACWEYLSDLADLIPPFVYHSFGQPPRCDDPATESGPGS